MDTLDTSRQEPLLRTEFDEPTCYACFRKLLFCLNLLFFLLGAALIILGAVSLTADADGSALALGSTLPMVRAPSP
jgi:hypothetical protein